MLHIYDSFSPDYKKPFGAVERNCECEFTLRFPADNIIEEAILVVFRPGQKERFTKLEFVDIKDNHAIYSCKYVPEDTGLHHYYFSVLINRNRHYIKRNGVNIGVVDNGDLFQLTVYEKGMTTPDWLKGGIMYQIFPDRFANSGIPKNDIPADRQIHTDWNETPCWRPDHRGMITNNDYYGGDLKGIQNKLDYLADLGVTVIYLNPIFEAHENHRYCTANYEKIDPLLGNEEDFVNLCKAALFLTAYSPTQAQTQSISTRLAVTASIQVHTVMQKAPSESGTASQTTPIPTNPGGVLQLSPTQMKTILLTPTISAARAVFYRSGLI